MDRFYCSTIYSEGSLSFGICGLMSLIRFGKGQKTPFMSTVYRHATEHTIKQIIVTDAHDVDVSQQEEV